MIIDIFGLTCAIWFLLVTCYTPSSFPTYFAFLMLTFLYLLCPSLPFRCFCFQSLYGLVWHSEALLWRLCGKKALFHFSYQDMVFSISVGSSLESSFLFVTICSRMESASSTRAFMLSWQFLVLKASVPASLSRLPFLTLHIAFFFFFAFQSVFWHFLTAGYNWAGWRSSSKLAIADMDWCGQRGRASSY